MKQNSLEVSQRLLKRFQSELMDFLHQVIIYYGTQMWYIYGYTMTQVYVENKRKMEIPFPTDKVFALFFFLFFINLMVFNNSIFLRTLNGAFNCSWMTIKLAYRRNRRDFPIRSVILLHDNARPRITVFNR